MDERRVRCFRDAAALTGLSAVPMLSVLLSNPHVDGFGIAACVDLLFIAGLTGLNVLATGCLILAPSRAVKRMAIGLVLAESALALPGFGSFAYDQLRQWLVTSGTLPAHRTLVQSLLVATLVALSVWLVRYRARALSSLASGACALLALLLVVLSGQAALEGVSFRPETLLPPPVGATTDRVVWIVMDELDEDLLEHQLTQLPAFQELRRHAIEGTQTFSPANFTHQSLPRLLVGRPLLSAEMTQNRISLRDRADMPSHSLASDPDFFIKRLADTGHSVAVAGWDLPYCAIVPKAVACRDDAAVAIPGIGISPWHWIWSQNSYNAWWHDWRPRQGNRPLQEIMLSIFTQPRLLKVNANAATLASLSASTLAQIDAGYDVVFAHWPCPHLPRMDGVVDTGPTAVMQAYAANVATCDTRLAAVLQHIERARGADARSLTLIVTSDHWLRARDCIEQGRLHCTAERRRRIPLLIRTFGPPGEEDAQRDYTRTINTLGLSRLVIKVAGQRGTTQADIIAMLDTFEDTATVIEPF